MRAVDIIIKKRDKGELSREEIEFFVQGLTTGEIPDYQVAAWAMAVLLNGMTTRETADLAVAMAHSGAVLDLSDVVDFAVDKHSSGGVGDKTSLVVLPVVAACGLPIGKMSGRGLGFTGGTLDKMESIPGFRCDLTTDEFKRQLKEIGVVLAGQNPSLAPADGKLYALRDVTGTVPSLPLIAASIMSKKIAAGAQAILLDIKVGSGAFLATVEEARQLARLAIDIGRRAGGRSSCPSRRYCAGRRSRSGALQAQPESPADATPARFPLRDRRAVGKSPRWHLEQGRSENTRTALCLTPSPRKRNKTRLESCPWWARRGSNPRPHQCE